MDPTLALRPPVIRRRRLPDWKQLPPPHDLLEVSVVMPVRDEARRLPAALRSLAAQRDADGAPFDPDRFEVIVLANNCSDDSAAIVRRFAARRPRLRLHVVEVVFPAAVAHVGHARACLMNEAWRRLSTTGGRSGVIASTDGDTRVDPGWLAATLAEVHAGADAVGGRIVMDADADRLPALARYTCRDDVYQRLRSRLEHEIDPDPVDPWPRHHQHFGASLAITTRAYGHVGGLPAEPFLEDEALYQALRGHDLKVRHSKKVSVVTSSRWHGRVAVGLSWQLREWASLARAGADAHVVDPVAWAEEIALRRRLRSAWDATAPRSQAAEQRLQSLAESLGVPARWLAKRVAAGGPFGTLWREVTTRRARTVPPPPPVSMRDAINAMRLLLARQRSKADARAGRAGSSRAASR